MSETASVALPQSAQRADDAALVARTLAGDLQAFEGLVERYQGLVHRVAARIVGRDEAEDVAQDAFLRAFHRLARFRGDASFRTWLLRIAHNAALDALARPRVVPLGPDEEEAAGEAAGGERTPAERLEESERRARLAEKIRLVRPTHRTVLVLRDLEGLSYEEIAEITQAPLGSVKGRLHRARGELVEILRRNTYDWGLPS